MLKSRSMLNPPANFSPKPCYLTIRLFFFRTETEVRPSHRFCFLLFPDALIQPQPIFFWFLIGKMNLCMFRAVEKRCRKQIADGKCVNHVASKLASQDRSGYKTSRTVSFFGRSRSRGGVCRRCLLLVSGEPEVKRGGNRTEQPTPLNNPTFGKISCDRAFML
jgi:hypothetical protein